MVDSVEVKTEAFWTLFRPYGDRIANQVVAYHHTHGGESRFEKFQYAFRELLRQSLSSTQAVWLGERFSQLVEETVCQDPYIAGVTEFLEATPLPLYVGSGTPQTVLRRTVTRRGLTHLFLGVFGAPPTKGQIIRQIVTDNYFDP